MTSAALQLNGVRSKLLQAAGSGTDAACVGGWLVGLRDATDTVVTSILQGSSGATALKHDVGMTLVIQVAVYKEPGHDYHTCLSCRCRIACWIVHCWGIYMSQTGL